MVQGGQMNSFTGSLRAEGTESENRGSGSGWGYHSDFVNRSDGLAINTFDLVKHLYTNWPIDEAASGWIVVLRLLYPFEAWGTRDESFERIMNGDGAVTGPDQVTWGGGA